MRHGQGKGESALLAAGQLVVLGVLLVSQSDPFNQIEARGDPVVGSEEAHGLVNTQTLRECRGLELDSD